jgi:uncharacterized membrane protein YbhN (UPF0104 family)
LPPRLRPNPSPTPHRPRSRLTIPSPRDVYWRAARWGIGLALVGGLLFLARPVQLVERLGRVSVASLTLLLILTAAWLLLGACNVFLLLRERGLAFRRFLPHFLTSWAASSLLPGQFGDATLVLWLREEGVPMSRTAAAYLVDKAVSLGWILVPAAVGVWLVLPVASAWLAPGLATCLVFALLFLARGGARTWIVERLAPRGFALEPLRRELTQLGRRPKRLVVNAAITICKWGVTALLHWVAFRAVGEVQPAIAVATLPFASSLVGYLPISVGGLGTMEWSAVALFAHYGATSTGVVAVYALLRGLLLGIVGFTLAATHLARLIRPRRPV